MKKNREFLKNSITDVFKVAAITLVVFASFFTLSEYLLARWYKHPPQKWQSVINAFRDHYSTYHWKIIQYEPNFARYDSELTYTLKPGAFTFQNVEFSVPFSVNSIGTRDDEESLASPEIVVTGDSFAMGWGVRQEETFSQLIEKKTGVKILNAAVSSYGTAREMGMLRRIDTSDMKVLVIQYCRNDYEENKSFYENNNRLPVSSAADYRKIVDDYLLKSRYYYGRYTLKLLPAIIRHPFKLAASRLNPDDAVSVLQDQEVEYFLHVLMNCTIPLNNVRIVVTELNTHNAFSDTFITALAVEVVKEKYPDWIRNMKVVNVSTILEEDDFFLIDGHINENGHRKVVDKLLSEVAGAL